MTKAQVKWMEEYMKPLKDLELIEPEEERRHWCFHIMVAGTYSDWRASHLLAAQADDRTTLDEITTVGLTEPTAATIQPAALTQ
jgi:hypothetical protein